MPRRWTSRLTPEMAARHRAAGDWRDRRITDELDAICAAGPEAPLIHDAARTLSRAETRRAAWRLCNAMRGRGLEPGDVVSFQLPNWWEAIVVELACAYGGYVCNPIVQIYRDAEVGYILGSARPGFFFTAESFRGFDHAAMLERLAPAMPDRCTPVFVRPEGSPGLTFDLLLAEGSDAPVREQVDPDAIKLLMYTSGTTGRAKGVLHSHNTIAAEIANFAGYIGLEQGETVLMPSPLGHITGYLYGIQLPITLTGSVVLMDRWDAREALQIIERHGVTFTIGATPFVQELGRVARDHGKRLPSLRNFPSGGAPVPPDVIRHAVQSFENCAVFRLYGSTEAPTVTLGIPDREQLELAATTEGRIVGHEVRLTDEDGTQVPDGEEGEIRARGPEICLGYYDAQDNAGAFDEDGYFRTGDLARLTPEGCLVITGRAKDLIVRGGENISPKEVEDVLYHHPAIADAAVVAMPHPRLGETGCAYVTLRPGASFTFDDMRAFLGESGLARQKIPERLEVVGALPFTAAGKVRKNILRDWATQSVEGDGQADDADGTTTHTAHDTGGPAA